MADSELLELSRHAARAREIADAHIAVIAGEIARRSSRELGSEGMAQRLGLRTPEELVRVTNRSTARDASAAVRELDEEMGIHVDEAPEEIACIGPCEETGWEHVRLFLARWDGVPRFPCAEVEAALWMKPEELEKWTTARAEDFASGFLECWKVARGR